MKSNQRGAHDDDPLTMYAVMFNGNTFVAHLMPSSGKMVDALTVRGSKLVYGTKCKADAYRFAAIANISLLKASV